jgi:regulator of protease activity HflC (stomatin/prohibitin superfamily)
MWDALINLLGKLKFYSIVMPDEAGIKIRRGRILDEIGPGFYWMWPVIDDIQVVTVTEQTIDTPNQPLMTCDGKSLGLSATLAYVITDAALATYGVMDFDEQLLQKVQPLLCQAINCRVLKDCWNNSIIEEEILLLAQEEAQNWGLKITDFRITAKTPCRVFALMTVE